MLGLRILAHVLERIQNDYADCLIRHHFYADSSLL
jgi:hypothetical protein